MIFKVEHEEYGKEQHDYNEVEYDHVNKFPCVYVFHKFLASPQV